MLASYNKELRNVLWHMEIPQDMGWNKQKYAELCCIMLPLIEVQRRE